MLELIGAASNVCYTVADDDSLTPGIELLLFTSEPTYRFNEEGDLEKERGVKTIRLSASPGGLKMVMKTILDTMRQIEARETKSNPAPVQSIEA